MNIEYNDFVSTLNEPDPFDHVTVAASTADEPELELIPQEEIACHSYEDAAKIAEILLRNGYCVMISEEENLFIVNYIWSERGADRNDVVFCDRGLYDDYIWKSFGND